MRPRELSQEQTLSTESGWGGFVQTLTAPFRRRVQKAVTVTAPALRLPEESPEKTTVSVNVTITTRKMSDVDEVGDSLSDDVRASAKADKDYFRVIFLQIPNGVSTTLWIPSNDLTMDHMSERMDHDWPIPSLSYKNFYPETWWQIGPRWDNDYTGTEEWALTCDEHGKIVLPEYLEKYRVG